MILINSKFNKIHFQEFFSVNGMSKVFFGTLISHAKHELAPIPTLLSRATNQFMTEQSINEAIKQLQKSQEILIKAKESYKTDYVSNLHKQEILS